MSKVVIYGKKENVMYVEVRDDESLIGTYTFEVEDTEKFQIGEWIVYAENNITWQFSYRKLPEDPSCAFYLCGEYEDAPYFSTALVFETEEKKPGVYIIS